MDGSWWRGLTTCGPLEKGMANHFSSLALKTHEQYEEAKRQDTEILFGTKKIGAKYATGDLWR